MSLEQAQQEVDDLIAAYRNTYGIAFIRDDYIHIRNRALNSLLSYCIMDNVVEDYGLDTFTQEESESLMQQAEEAYEQTLEYSIKQSMLVSWTMIRPRRWREIIWKEAAVPLILFIGQQCVMPGMIGCMPM